MPDSHATRCVLAYSGGLDTSYCIHALRQSGYEVHTLTVNTGGFSVEELADIATRARQLGAASYTVVDARARLFQEHLRFLIWGNCLRGQVYPLCVGAERFTQARATVEHARELGAAALAHGSTGAGNDQVRFDMAFRVLAPDLRIETPIRSRALERPQMVALLAELGIQFPASRGRYSVNRGLWGTTIGGGETHNSWTALPEEAWADTAAPSRVTADPAEHTLTFEHGLPVALDGEVLSPVELLERLHQRAVPHGVGRGYHLGDTILGIKGRIAFEAPAPLVILAAHRELEKLVLTSWQQFWKEQLAQFYGKLLHEALAFDPVMRDIEALLESSQQRVCGEVRVRLDHGQILVTGARSPYSMMNTDLARYGEGQSLWSPADAEGFISVYSVPSRLAALAAKAGQNTDEGEGHA